MKPRFIALTALFLSAASIALAQSHMHAGMDMAATDPATIAYMQSMTRMHDAMAAMKPTNDPSRDFVLMMEPHHQAAVEMAETYLKYGTDPTLTKMSKDIIASQTAEIADMKAWLAAHPK